MLQSFIECVQTILPYFSEKPEGQLKLPVMSMSKNNTTEACISDLFRVQLTLLCKQMFLDNTEVNLAAMIRNGIFDYRKAHPCLWCRPLVEWMYMEMSRGLDLFKLVNFLPGGWPPVALPSYLISSINGYDHEDELCTCHIGNALHPPVCPVKCDCCLWSLLELMLHCRANLQGLVDQPTLSCASASLKCLLSEDPDGISPKILKEAGSTIAPSLTRLINLSLQTSKIPKLWKQANVVPIHKKGKKELLANYRPISLLPVPSKILERVVFKQVYNYLHQNKILSKDQSGLRQMTLQSISCLLCIMNFVKLLMKTKIFE